MKKRTPLACDLNTWLMPLMFIFVSNSHIIYRLFLREAGIIRSIRISPKCTMSIWHIWWKFNRSNFLTHRRKTFRCFRKTESITSKILSHNNFLLGRPESDPTKKMVHCSSSSGSTMSHHLPFQSFPWLCNNSNIWSKPSQAVTANSLESCSASFWIAEILHLCEWIAWGLFMYHNYNDEQLTWVLNIS